MKISPITCLNILLLQEYEMKHVKHCFFFEQIFEQIIKK